MRVILIGALAALTLSGCGGSGTSDGRPVVLASTTQVADLARQIAGPDADVHGLLKPNSDPHEYELFYGAFSNEVLWLIQHNQPWPDALTAEVVRGALDDAGVSATQIDTIHVANAFGQNALTGGDKSTVTIKPGEPFRLRYGILIHSAAKDKPTDLKAAYADYLAQTK